MSDPSLLQSDPKIWNPS